MPFSSVNATLDAPRAVTLKDVAAIAGVSSMSVSAVLNGGGKGTRYVSQEARQRIVQAAEQLGYRRNGFAAATATGRFGSVALLTSARENYSYTPRDLLNGINAALAAHDWHLMLANLPDEKLTDEGFMPKILREWMADGLLLDYIQNIPPRLLELIARHQIPAIWINSNPRFNCVHPDDLDAGRRVTQHLLRQGHRRIAFVDFSHTSHLEREHYSAADRCQGYTDAMNSGGCATQIVRGKDTNLPPDRWMEVCTALFAAPDRPTACVTYSREVAALTLAALQLGYSVPRDLSIVTFGKAEVEIAGRPITAMLLPEYEVGRAAVTALNDKMQSPSEDLPARAIRFGFQEGATSAPPQNPAVPV